MFHYELIKSRGYWYRGSGRWEKSHKAIGSGPFLPYGAHENPGREWYGDGFGLGSGNGHTRKDRSAIEQSSDLATLLILQQNL